MEKKYIYAYRNWETYTGTTFRIPFSDEAESNPRDFYLTIIMTSQREFKMNNLAL